MRVLGQAAAAQRFCLPTGVIPAKAGTQWDLSASAGDAASHQVPAFAGMTPVGMEAPYFA
jgi:hypothetical protein